MDGEFAEALSNAQKSATVIHLEQPTLRDLFAMAALTGLIAAYPDTDATPREMAKDAFKYADECMNVREQS